MPEGRQPTLLGPSMWKSQETYAAATVANASIYFLKARQLGESTIAIAYDAWRLRFGPTNCRVSVLTQTDENSKQLLRDVVFGLERLPPALRLPLRSLEHCAILDAGRRTSGACARTPRRTRSAAAVFHHVHLDEWAAMTHPQKVWMAVEESIVPGGTIHVFTTGVGGGDVTADVWRKSKVGETRFHPLFIGALERDDRSPAWYEEKRRTTDAQTLRQELPLTEEDALSGAGEFRFGAESLDICTAYPRGLQPWEPDRKFLISVDPGEKDGTAIVVLSPDARSTGSIRGVVDVVGFRLMRPTTLRDAQVAIEQMARDYPNAPVVVEINGIGIGLVRNLRVPAHRLHEHTTSQLSKRRMVSNLAVAVQNAEVSWDARACPDLDREMRSYKDRTQASDRTPSWRSQSASTTST